MEETDRFALTGSALDALGDAEFPGRLAALLRATVAYDYTVIFCYLGSARPIDLFDDFPAQRRKVFVKDYQEGPYLLDPFHLAAVRPVADGLYRMREIAPDRFYQGEYFRNYYVQTGLAEEIGFVVALPDRAALVISLMRSDRLFSTRDMRLLREVWPVVAAMARRHWQNTAGMFPQVQEEQASDRPAERIERAFFRFGDGVLTPREREVVAYTLKGHSADAIGRILSISSGTVRIHRRNIYAKLRISSQGELFSRFIATLALP